MVDTKLSALTATTSIDGTELLYVVEDPSGTPLSRKVTAANFKAYAAGGKQTIWVPAGALQTRTTSGAEATTREINSITVPVQKFDTTTQEGVNFSVALPKSWNVSTLTWQAIWTAASGSGTIEFELRGGSFADDDAINTSGFGTAVAVTDTLITANDVHITSESAALTLASAGDNEIAFFEIIRDVANDTLSVDAELIGIRLFYTTDAGDDA